MLYTLKLKLLADARQRELLAHTMKIFSEICNFISDIGIQTNTIRNKIKLQKHCYYVVREKYGVPAQMVVRAVGKVVETYKSGAKKTFFGETSAVVYDKRTLAFKMIERVSLTTIEGRIEIPFLVTGYRKGIYERRQPGQADLIVQNNDYYLLLVIDLPEVENISPIEFTEINSYDLEEKQ
ncbi:hypothetical protein Theco_4033 (plasmid) [Thermobacillus composti KWC4]|uniref:Transposase n=1 Tax=Thermobacillus composti (strain DSM 18247 / JCM 13945 / KWC4) TaxID=717605 RepID=L0EL72_THECK|nr:hypothetical protein Theco_4033 [Thermobacillus composti KWC4]